MLFVTLVSVVLLVNAPHFSQAQSVCNLEPNIDFFGNDITYVFVTDTGACCNLCSFYPGCQAWTFVSTANACWLKSSATPTRVTAAGRTSGLKANSTTATTTAAPVTLTTVTTPTTPATTVTTTSTAVTTPVTTAAPVTTTATTTASLTTTKEFGCFIENNINYIGNDLSSQFVNTMGDCCNLCGATTGCVVWAYWADFNFCYLKNQLPSLSQRQPFTNMFSGIITLN